MHLHDLRSQAATDVRVWVRCGKTLNQPLHVTRRVHANDSHIFLVGCRVRAMYGLGWKQHFLGLMLCEPLDIAEFEKNALPDQD